MGRREQINEEAAKIVAATANGYGDEFKAVVADFEDRHTLETRQEVWARLSGTTPNPAT